jgi:hypothetical protein
MFVSGVRVFVLMGVRAGLATESRSRAMKEFVKLVSWCLSGEVLLNISLPHYTMFVALD